MSPAEKVRASHWYVKRRIKGREAWITSAPWGWGVRFYLIGVGYPGMVDKVKDGDITLIEKL